MNEKRHRLGITCDINDGRVGALSKQQLNDVQMALSNGLQQIK